MYVRTNKQLWLLDDIQKSLEDHMFKPYGSHSHVREKKKYNWLCCLGGSNSIHYYQIIIIHTQHYPVIVQ